MNARQTAGMSLLIQDQPWLGKDISMPHRRIYLPQCLQIVAWALMISEQ